jgi:hypothetical protein
MSQNKLTMEDLRKRIFLLEKKEVVLTGRTASKINQRRKDTLLFEVKPANPNIQGEKKWVRLDELYEIHHSQAPPTYERLIEEVRKVVERGKMKDE